MNKTIDIPEFKKLAAQHGVGVKTIASAQRFAAFLAINKGIRVPDQVVRNAGS